MEKVSENAEKFHCELCEFECCKKSNYDKHILTQKHQNRTFLNILEQKNAKKCQTFICKKCNKQYNARNSLWYHEKKCYTNMNDSITNESNINESSINELNNIDITDSNIIIQLIKQNEDFKNLLIEQNKTIIELSKNNSITNNNNNINSHNKSFNLNFFLNETCKDAMNIMDFVDSIKLQLSDLESVGKLGYIEGISKIIVSNLNSLDETKRPVHCADSKREVMYVKDDNKWEKESADKTKLRNAIKRVTQHNTKLLKEFRIKYPGCDKSDSKYSTKYDKLTLEAFGGKGDDYEGKENKIIRNIAKNVIIDKN